MKQRLFIAFVFAALVHAALSQVRFRIVPVTASRDNASDPIEIEALDSMTKPVVQSSRLKEEDPQAKDQEAKYGAEHRNRVSKEMQAARKGRFQQGQGAPEQVPGLEGEEGVPTPKLSDLMAYGMSPNDISKDIELGNQTILNTDPVKYAAFINRIADKIYDSWVYYARDAAKSVYLTGRKIERNTYITRLQIVIDEGGEVRAIQTLASSGIVELDEAPKRAFWDVEPFTHPPSQMFGKEGLVRFVYEFHFEWKTSSFNIIPPAI